MSPVRPRGPHITGIPFHWHCAGPLGCGIFRRVEFDVIADEKIEKAVAVIVEKSAARSPANLFVEHTGLFGDVGERAVAVVAEENVVAPEVQNRSSKPSLL